MTRELWGVLAAAVVLIVGIFMIRRWWIQLKRLPDGAVPLYRERHTDALNSQLIGAFMLVGIGSYGAQQIRRLLVVLAQCGLEPLVGSVLIVENDSQQRKRFHEAIPPSYHDRVVYGFSDAYSGGMSNLPIAEVLEYVDIWGVPIERATYDVIDLHLRRNGNRAPSDIFTWVSLGGHGPLGLLVADRLHTRFAESQMVAFTALPTSTRLRERYRDLKAAYEKRGVIGWGISDNLGDDPASADFGMVATIVGLSDAALHGDQGTQPNNAFRLALTRDPGAVLIYQVVPATVISYPHQPIRWLPPFNYYVNHAQLVDQITASLRTVEQGKGIWSAALPSGEPDTTTFDLVLTSIWHDDLTKVRDDVIAGRKLRRTSLLNGHNGHESEPGVLFGQPNYETPFASIATDVNTDKPVCPIVAVRLAAVRNGALIVDEIVKAPRERALPAPLTTLPAPSGQQDEPTRELMASKHNTSDDTEA